MTKNKTLIIIFLPAIIIAGLALFIRIIQYQPLYPDLKDYENLNGQTGFNLPIYPEDPIIGNKKAPKTIVAFEDYSCQGCKIQSTILNNLLEKYPDKIKIIWKGLPVSQFPYPSKPAHDYAFCINEQGEFNKFYQLAFTNGGNLSNEILDVITEQIDLNQKDLKTCLESNRPQLYVEKTEQLGMVLNIQSVPTFFVNNKQVTTPTTLEGWEMLLGL